MFGPPSYFSEEEVDEDDRPIDFTTERRIVFKSKDGDAVAVIYDTDPLDDEANEIRVPAPDEKITWCVGANTETPAGPAAALLNTTLENKRP